jgi:glycosyltransferase involved in cell wall biosynthesis
MSISVALGTYNGAVHLAEQLDSFAAQTRLPDELVVCDDCSTDTSADILRAFAARATFPVRVRLNPKNIGSTKNYEQAIGMCSCDIIALSDQDDVWVPNKLARLEAVFRDCPDAGLVMSDALLVDHALRPLGPRLWDTINFTVLEQNLAERGEGPLLLTQHNVVTGAACAFRANLRDLLLPIPCCWIHDGWIGIIATSVAPWRLIREPLLYYRQHAGQQIGARRFSLRSQVQTASRLDAVSFERAAQCYEAARDRLATIRSHLTQADLPDLMADRAEWDRSRAKMRGAGRLGRVPEVARQTMRGRYGRFGLGILGWKSLLADLVL